MAKQNFIWTCLPNGLSDDRSGLHVSVLLSPRLVPEIDAPQVASFQEWLDWPATLAGAVFVFFADGLPAVKCALADLAGLTHHDTGLGTPDGAVWRALFRADLPVKGYDFNAALLDSEINSYSTTDVHELVRDLYVDLAARSGADLPRIGLDLIDDPTWREMIDAVAEVDRWGRDREGGRLPQGDAETQIERRFGGLAQLADSTRAGTARGGFLDKVRHLARFELFHTPPLRPVPLERTARMDDPRIEVASQEFERPPAPTPQELADTMDFHAVVAAMNAYPTLQRRLGLVVDFVLDRAAFPQNADFGLRVDVEFPPLPTRREPADVSPVTRVRHGDADFAAISRVPPGPGAETRIERGLLDLYSQADRYAVLQADVDGAGLKTMNFARSLGRYRQDAVADPALLLDDVSRRDKRAGAPALRTAGLMLVRKDRALALDARMKANKQQAMDAAAPAPALELWAEDLVRGYRIDAWDGRTMRWRSLCRRTAEYRLAAGALVVTPTAGEEEATVQLAATRSPDPTYNPNVISLHEALVSWTGWSLGAPPPGKGIGDDLDPGPDGKPPFTDGAGSVPGLDLEPRFRALPGSLPRLRYGRRYALRARAVDLAGNSLPPDEADIGPERPDLSAQPFLRFEPVAAPVLALLRPAGGATPPPREGESMHRLVIRSFNDVFGDPTPTPQIARREALPAQSTVREAELHGALDRAGALDATAFAMLANDKDRDARDPAAALVEEKIPLKGPLDATPVDTVFAVWREGMALSYLPDPLALSVSAWFLDHPRIPAAETLRIDLYPDGTSWPDAAPFGVELVEDALDPLAKPDFDAVRRVLRVPLAKGERVTLRLATRIAKRDLFERMGVWGWLDAATQAQIADAALDGRCWLFTPWQDIELVHAVQRPLIAPAIEDLVIDREPDATCARPRFRARCSLRSTDRLDLDALWNDPQDATAEPEPQARARADLAFQVKVTEARDYVAGPDAHPEHTSPAEENAGPDVIGVNDPRRDRLARKPHEFNDTRYRRIEYRLKATTRHREYLPPAVLLADIDPVSGAGRPVEDNIVVEGPATVSWIPNSAPPPPPQILYVVPTFGWVRSHDAAGVAQSWRRGGGLRVYLDRPWNVTGFGEMLAVVLAPAEFGGDPATTPASRPYAVWVTQWGADPIWRSPFVTGVGPARDRFPLARLQPDPSGAWLPPNAPPSEADQRPGAFQTRLWPRGAPAPVDIAPHDVFFDAERRLWFCDIEIDGGQSYWPFVRLALARYQPCSIDGAHLSDVALADIMQLTADRWLTVRPEREGRIRHVTVSGPGYDASGGSHEVRPRSEIDPLTGAVTEVTPVSPTSIVEVWLERLEPALGEDFGWRRIADGAPTTAVAGVGASPFDRAQPIERIAPERNLRANRMVAVRDFEGVLAQGLTDRFFLRPPLWDGRVTLPAEDQGRLRLVVAEYEEYPIDGAPDRHSTTSTRTGRRLVFVEHVPLT